MAHDSNPHNPPFHLQRPLLPLKAVKVECLDQHQKPFDRAVASGFLRRESGRLYLYTAWHVVTGFDPHHVVVPFTLPARRFLRVVLQNAQELQPGVQSIGGSQSVTIPLYADTTVIEGRMQPLWLQNDLHIPHELLNHVGLHVPFWNDVVKIELPDALHISDLQVVHDSGPAMPPVGVGDKCLVVGYPYGFSAAIGVDQPTPVVFTRFIASAHITGHRKFEFFLDGYGAPGMSGGPVFLDAGHQLQLIGIYTGDIYPDHLYGREKSTALGTVGDLRMTLGGHTHMTRHPSRPVSKEGRELDRQS